MNKKYLNILWKENAKRHTQKKTITASDFWMKILNSTQHKTQNYLSLTFSLFLSSHCDGENGLMAPRKNDTRIEKIA